MRSMSSSEPPAAGLPRSRRARKTIRRGCGGGLEGGSCCGNFGGGGGGGGRRVGVGCWGIRAPTGLGVGDVGGWRMCASGLRRGGLVVSVPLFDAATHGGDKFGLLWS